MSATILVLTPLTQFALTPASATMYVWIEVFEILSYRFSNPAFMASFYMQLQIVKDAL